MTAFLDLVSYVPDWVPLAVLPAAFFLYVLTAALWRGRRFFLLATSASLAAGTVLTASRGGAAAAAYCGLFVLFALVCRLLFLLPRRRPSLPSLACVGKTEPTMSAKACPFEEMPRYTARERGLELGRAEEMLLKLRMAPLAPSDRLETEVLMRSLSALGGKRMTEEELCRLNDDLASLLKLTAKYKL